MQQPIAHIHSLTGLRFFAALLVFVHHSDGFRIHGAPYVEYPLGAIGVAFFFVLSGFIMTYVYGERLERRNVPKFYLTRIARIWPLHLTCLLIFLMTSTDLQAILSESSECWSLVVNAFLLQSWTFDREWIVSFNGPSWSLSTEMGFYLFFPLLILIGKRPFLVVYVLIAILTVALLQGIDWAYHYELLPEKVDIDGVVRSFPLLRVFEFATGILTAHLFQWRRAKHDPVNSGGSLTKSTFLEVAAFALVIVCVALLWSGNKQLFPWLTKVSGPAVSAYVWNSGASITFAVLIFVFAGSSGLLSRFFGSPVIAYLGEISFSFYLIHRIVIRSFVRQIWLADMFSGIGVVLIVFTISIGLSAILYSFVELPCKQAIIELLRLGTSKDNEDAGAKKNRFAAAYSAWLQTARKLAWRWPFAVLVLLTVGLLAGAWIISAVEKDNDEYWKLIYQGRRASPDVADVDFEDAAVLRAVSFRGRKDTLVVRSVWVPHSTIDQSLAVSLQGKKEGRVIISDPVVDAESIKSHIGGFWVHESKYPIQDVRRGSHVVFEFVNRDGTAGAQVLRVPVPRELTYRENLP